MAIEKTDILNLIRSDQLKEFEKHNILLHDIDFNIQHPWNENIDAGSIVEVENATTYSGNIISGQVRILGVVTEQMGADTLLGVSLTGELLELGLNENGDKDNTVYKVIER